MNQQEKLAREWAECAKDNEVTSPGMEAAAEYILAHTAPSTMEDVRWDHETMPGTGALTENGDLWIMRDDAGDSIDCISPDLVEIAFVAKGCLTPNGKRYKLVEASVSSNENVADDQPDHPAVLETVEDFEDAPVGTILLVPGERPRSVQKIGVNSWRLVNSKVPVSDMTCAVSARTHGAPHVLWWGGEA